MKILMVVGRAHYRNRLLLNLHTLLSPRSHYGEPRLSVQGLDDWMGPLDPIAPGKDPTDIVGLAYPPKADGMQAHQASR